LICIGGEIRGQTDFGGGPLPKTGDTQAFLACYNLQPWSHSFSRLFGGTLNTTSFTYVNNVAIDGSGEVYVVGGIGDTMMGSGTFDFGSGPVSNQARDAFIAAVDSAGSHVFARVFSGAAGDDSHHVHLGPAGAYVSAEFVGTVDFAGQAHGVDATAWGGLIAVTPSGTIRWVADLGAASPRASAIVGDHLWVTGVLDGVLTVGTKTLVSFGLDVVLVELDRT
jgi:hypothetical protein